MTPEEFRDRAFELAQGEDNTYRVAARLLDGIADPADWETIARLTAPPYISNMLKRILPPAGGPKTGTGRGEPVPTFTDAAGNRRASAVEVRLVDWWARRLAVKVATSTGDKALGACTANDLDWIAARRHAKAAEDTAAAVRYEKLAQALRDSGKTTVAEIDSDTGRSILDG